MGCGPGLSYGWSYRWMSVFLEMTYKNGQKDQEVRVTNRGFLGIWINCDF